MINHITTKDYIAASLIEIMQNKSIKNITIKDIVNNCQLTSTTFYNHFIDKYDLLSWIYKTNIGYYINKMNDSYDWYHAARDSLTYIKDNLNFYRNALINTHGQDSFRNASFDINYSEALKIITKKNPDFVKDELNLFSLKLYFYGVTSISTEILTSNSDFDPVIIARQLMSCMPINAQVYLLYTNEWKK